MLSLEGAIGAVVLGLVVAILSTASATFRSDRDAVIGEALTRIDLVASVAATRIRDSAASDAPKTSHLDAAVRGLPGGSLKGQEVLALFDVSGALVASSPPLARPPRSILDLLGDSHPLSILADRAGAMTITLADGTEALAAVRNLPSGQIAVVQPTAALFDRSWLRQRVPSILAVLVGTGLIGLGGALAFQARRAKAATGERDLMRRRVETSLTRGRCGLWDWDVSRGRVFWSNSMYELLGYECREEPLSFGEVNGMIHPGDGDLYVLAERVAASPSLHIDHDFRARTASGQWLWLRARAEVVTERDGTRHLIGIAVDITDERGFVEQSATADMRLRDAVEAISEAFVLWDDQNRLVLCNSKFRLLHGLSGDRAIAGATYAEIMAASRPPVVEHQLTREVSDGDGARTLEAQLADGRWLHINERRTRDGGFVSVGTDITTLKRNEAKLLDSERRLIDTVVDLKASRETLQTQAQQLAELAELHLEQKSQAESANRAKTDFLAKMSHELRTPLNAVIGFAEVMQGEMFGPLGNPRYLDYSNDIHASGLFLLSLINDILQMSRIEAGLITLSPEPIPISEAVERAVKVVAESAREKGVTVTIVAADVALQADERALNQVLVHLLRNAVKFTRQGGKIRVRVKRAGEAANVFVEDSGIGIPRDFLPRLGRPFEQVEPEFNRTQAGSGLGIAIAKAFTEMHGGGLRIRSQEQVGTVVLVHLPLTPRSAKAGPDIVGEPFRLSRAA